jgi:mRNA-degrading endonuclease YafQ of YafQ-DinJ toxin-antitoxin module
MPPYRSLDFTSEFMDAYSDLGQVEQRRIRAALLRLDADDRHPSLRVHQLQGDLAGQWSAAASDSLRITFERQPNGRKLLLGCSRHYGD